MGADDKKCQINCNEYNEYVYKKLFFSKFEIESNHKDFVVNHSQRENLRIKSLVWDSGAKKLSTLTLRGKDCHKICLYPTR